MKNLFLAMLIGAVVLVSCSKDDGGNDNGDPLVTNVTLPSTGTSFASGETVTITGSGFTASDAILFRVPTKATAPTTDIRATIIKVTATELAFKVPEGLPAGENSVILKRNDSEMVLGKIAIETEDPTPEPEPATAKLYGVGFNETEQVSAIYEIDQTDGTLTEIALLKKDEDISDMVAIKGANIIYGIDWPKMGIPSVCSFDIATRTYKHIVQLADLACIGVIDNQLYALRFGDDAKLSLTSVDSQTGNLTDIASFGTFEPDNAQDIYFQETPFVYDPQSGNLLVSLYIYDGTDELLYQMALNKNTGTIKLSKGIASPGCYLFRMGDRICAGDIRVINYNQPNESSVTDICTVNPETLERGEKLAEIPGYWYEWTYIAQKNTIYSVQESGEEGYLTLGAYDFNQNKFSELVKQVAVYDVIAVE